MIRLHRLNGVPLYLNSNLIEHIDASPDTLVTLTSGPKFMVSESPEEVCEKVFEYQKAVHSGTLEPSAPPDGRLDVAHGR